MAPSLSGIFPALTTPLENGSISLSGLKSNVEKFNRTELSGYVVLGSTGESILMNDRERIEALKAVRSAAGAGRIVIAGTGMPSTRATVEFTNRAAEEGADYGLVVTPFFYKSQMTAENLEIYYREVAEKSRIPVIMYNVPKFTGLSLALEVVSALADHPNIAGLKDSSGNIAFLTEIIRACPEDFVVFQGMGSVLYPSLELGAKGGILALANMAPVETVEIFQCTRTGEQKKAREIQMRIIGVNQKIVGGYGVPGIKYALDLLGYSGGNPLPPLQPVDEKGRASIRQVLRDGGLL
jgi:4-hydroxy-2-oxoglutarate aldolase